MACFRGTIRGWIARFWRGREGVSAVEFAIVAPLFAMVLVGILIYGIYFGVALGVSQLAAEAARASIAGLSDTERAQLALARADEMVASNGLLNADRLNVVAAPDSSDTKTFVVTVTYDASNLPIFGFDGLVPTPSPTITRTSAIKRGGY